MSRVSSVRGRAPAIDLGNSAAVREQVSLNQHGIAQLGADFVIARARDIAAPSVLMPRSRVSTIVRAASSPDTIA